MALRSIMRPLTAARVPFMNTFATTRAMSCLVRRQAPAFTAPAVIDGEKIGSVSLQSLIEGNNCMYSSMIYPYFSFPCVSFGTNLADLRFTA